MHVLFENKTNVIRLMFLAYIIYNYSWDMFRRGSRGWAGWARAHPKFSKTIILILNIGIKIDFIKYII
jgi:hypothetical protein